MYLINKIAIAFISQKNGSSFLPINANTTLHFMLLQAPLPSTAVHLATQFYTLITDLNASNSAKLQVSKGDCVKNGALETTLLSRNSFTTSTLIGLLSCSEMHKYDVIIFYSVKHY